MNITSSTPSREAAACASAQPWTLNSYRRVAGAFFVNASAPDGALVNEAIDVFVERMAGRQWATPQVELDDVAALADWTGKHRS